MRGACCQCWHRRAVLSITRIGVARARTPGKWMLAASKGMPCFASSFNHPAKNLVTAAAHRRRVPHPRQKCSHSCCCTSILRPSVQCCTCCTWTATARGGSARLGALLDRVPARLWQLLAWLAACCTTLARQRPISSGKRARLHTWDVATQTAASTARARPMPVVRCVLEAMARRSQ